MSIDRNDPPRVTDRGAADTRRPSPRRPGWWSLGCEHLRVARRRLVPRLRRALLAGWIGARRSTTRTVRALPGLLVAVVLVVVLKSGPLGRSWLGSPKWGMVAAEVFERVLAWGWKLHLALAALAGLGYLVGWTSIIGGLLLAPAALFLTALAAREGYRHTSFARARARFGADGWADFWELHRNLSAHAVRHIAVHQRRSLAAALPAVPDRRQAGTAAAAAAVLRRTALIEQLPVTETGTWLGRTAVGPWWGVQTYAAHRDVLGLVAPPQTGKTALMIHHVIDHPGAVVSTSTKPEVYLYTAALRAAISGPEHIALFNPDNLGGLGSTLRWCPVRGCADYRFAAVRAGLLVGARAGGGDDEKRWNEWATNVLTGLLMVADLDGRSMTDVARWVHNPTDPEYGAMQARKLMERYSRRVPVELRDALNQVLTTRAEKTRDSVFFAMRGAVGFMADPTIAWLCTPGRDEPTFDVERFIDARGALYLLGSEEQNTSSAPLLAAFTGHVFATAKNLAARRGGRLDPPLLISLDEAALITPVPLPTWVADAGGRGIHIAWSVQTPSQLRERWGDQGAETILNATNALMVFGGLKAKRDLEEVSAWCGTRHELVPDPDGPDGQGRAKFERVPVCPPDRVRVIPAWHALLVHRTTPATVVRIWPGWARPDVKTAGPLPGSGLPVPTRPAATSPTTPGSTVPDPTIPEPTAPEPTTPEPTVPEPTVPPATAPDTIQVTGDESSPAAPRELPAGPNARNDGAGTDPYALPRDDGRAPSSTTEPGDRPDSNDRPATNDRPGTDDEQGAA